MFYSIYVTRSFLFSDIPWILVIYAMSGQQSQIIEQDTLSELETVIRWFSSPTRIVYYILSVIIRALLIPLIRLSLGIMIKRLLGLNMESKSWDSSQMALLRRYINSIILSDDTLNSAFKILGVHYEAVSVSLRVRLPRFRLITILAILDCLQGNGC
jgi:hypothetical protein